LPCVNSVHVHVCAVCIYKHFLSCTYQHVYMHTRTKTHAQRHTRTPTQIQIRTQNHTRPHTHTHTHIPLTIENFVCTYTFGLKCFLVVRQCAGSGLSSIHIFLRRMGITGPSIVLWTLMLKICLTKGTSGFTHVTMLPSTKNKGRAHPEGSR